MGERTAVVTGACSGIGAATARGLAGEGFRVVGAAPHEDRMTPWPRRSAASRSPATSPTTPPSPRSRSCRARGSTYWSTTRAAPSRAGAVEAGVADWPGCTRSTCSARCGSPRRCCRRWASGDGMVVNLGSTAGGSPTRAGAAIRPPSTAQGGRRDAPAGARPAAGPVLRDRPRHGAHRGFSWCASRRRGEARRHLRRGREPLVAEDIADAIRWIGHPAPARQRRRLVVRPDAQAAQHKVHRTG